MVARMPSAFVAAAGADGHASLQQRPGDAGLVGGLAAYHPEGGGAHIGAVPAQPDARDHVGQVLFVQVIVGVGDAGLGAVAERVDGCRQQAGSGAQGTWVGVQQLPGVAHGPSASVYGDTATATVVPLARMANRMVSGSRRRARGVCSAWAATAYGACHDEPSQEPGHVRAPAVAGLALRYR